MSQPDAVKSRFNKNSFTWLFMFGVEGTVFTAILAFKNARSANAGVFVTLWTLGLLFVFIAFGFSIGVYGQPREDINPRVALASLFSLTVAAGGFLCAWLLA